MKFLKGNLLILVIMIVIGFGLCIGTVETPDKYQYLNSIDYQVKMQANGSMQVVETWDIDVKNTNTLFKTFNLNSYKYGSITDVEVRDLKTGKVFDKVYEEMYHVTKDCYYSLPISNSTFEIAWGIGMDNEKGNRKFQISYTVDDVVTEYTDYQEIYWQFIAEGQNSVPAKQVTGTVTLPQNVSNMDNLKVWGHGQLNGIIEKVNNNTVTFSLKNLNPGSRLEIRIATLEKAFNVSYNKVREYPYLTHTIEEETKWANEANEKAESGRANIILMVAIYIIAVLYFVHKVRKYYKLKNKENDGIIHNTFEYYREIPREDATPIEACYLYKFDKTRLDTQKVQNQAVSSTIMDLCLKKVISLRIEDKQILVRVLPNEVELEKDENEIYKLLKEVSNGDEEFNIEDLNQYAKKEYAQYSESINKMVNYARNRLYDLKLIDKVQEKQYSKCKNAKAIKSTVLFIYIQIIVIYLISLLPMFKIGVIIERGMDFYIQAGITLLSLIPLIIVATYSWKLKAEVAEKIAVLTQEGVDEQEKWKGLSNFMKEYSLLNEKEVPELVLWEKYLVYATAFGIADKVLEQMKATYPEVFIKEEWNENMKKEYPIIYFSTYSYRHESTISSINKLNNKVNTAYRTSTMQMTKHSSSSGSGGGGGFSGGGGGRWWRPDGMGGR